jgi:hypothetical protein
LLKKIRKNPGKQKYSKISSVIPKTPDSLSTSKNHSTLMRNQKESSLAYHTKRFST